VRLLVTSRLRPTWATARQMLYGEILEIGRGALALTHEEARAVLPDRKAEEVAGLMALTEGWPAVIGLTSFTTDPVASDTELPDTLYEYCAEELFQKFPVELRGALCTIALAPSIAPDLIRALYGDEAPRIAAAAEESGFLTRAPSGDYDMHPLLRPFLLRKLEEQGAERTGRAIRDLASHLLGRRQWDDALAVAARANDPGLLEEAIDGALDELVAQGRLEALKQWVAQARSDSPSAILDLAEAEVSFRQGDTVHALLQATNAASQLPKGHSRLSHSWFRAGQSAYFLDRAEEAREFCERARNTASNSTDAKDALWGLFNAALDLGDRNADSFLRDIEALRPLTLSDEVRVAGGGVFFATRWGGLEAALGRARMVVDRLADLDPMVQTGFLNNYSHGLVLTARYEDALSLLELELERAREFSMDFVIPHALLLKAAACMGIRRFEESRSTLMAAAPGDDPYLTAIASVFGSRIHLSESRPDEAAAILTRSWEQHLTSAVRGDLVATKALALAALRRFGDALLACEEALELSETIETLVLVESTRAIVGIGQESPGSAELAQTAFRLALERGNLDSFVWAYRAHPGLLRAIAGAPDLTEALTALLARAHDVGLARRAGLRADSFSSSNWRLTKREREILGLLAQGLTNREIAQQLVLAEVTVKVHVRHILKKLGVRSRTEAAVRAALTTAGD
jgi:DNA-binding CsgD family transcriptional regulator/tetratricopeptide (TPR) repeat protein